MFILRLAQCLSLVLLSFASSIAQSNFLSGYIVTSSNDTIQGLVDNRSEITNARQVNFKRTLSAETASYGSTDLIAYGFTGSKMYESKKVGVDSATMVVAFLELLVKGNISLYHLKDNDRFYVEKAGQEILPLFETKVKAQQGDRTYFMETRKIYLGVLNNLMADCASVQKAVRGAKLNYSSLMDLVNAYNHCGLEKNSFQTKRKFLLLKKGILAGAQATSIRFSTISAALPEYAFLTKADFASDIQPFGGLFINSTFPWITDKVSLQLEAQFLKAHYYSNVEYKQYNVYTIHDAFTIDLSYLRFPLLLRYTYPKGKWRPFIQAGMLNDFVLNKKVHLISQQQGGQSSVHTTERTEMNMSKYYIHGAVGAGVTHPFLRKLWWSMEVRAALGNSMGDNAIKARYKAQTNILFVQTAISF